MIAPLWDEEKNWFGAILAANKPSGFHKEDINLVETVSSQVIAVIQNARLLNIERRRVEQLSALHAIATAATEADNEDQLIESVTHLIGERLYPDSFGVLLLDAPAGELLLHSSYRIGVHEVPMRLPLGVGFAGTVAKSGKPRREGNISISSENLSLYPLTKSELCVPLKVEEELLGIVNAESTKINAFTREDEELLTIIAGQLATAIQRLRVVKAEHYQTEQLARSNSLIRALAQVNAQAAVATDPDSIMQTLGKELIGLGMNCLIALSNTTFQEAVVRYISLQNHTLKVLERLTKNAFHNYVIPIEKLGSYAKANAACLITDPAAIIRNLAPGFSMSITRKTLELTGVTEKTIVCHLPLISEGKPVGILWMWGNNLQESDLPTMSLFARQVAAVLQNASLLAEVRRLAITDDLTGIFNRRHFFELAQKEFSRSQRNSRPLVVMIVDLDRFKQFNDYYGHAIGDRILRDTARRMQSALRESDVIGRYGGEEFSLILPETDVNAGVQIAERLIAKVTDNPIETEAGALTVRISVGVAGMSEETPTLHALINHADQAMYNAKAAGHNCIRIK